MTERFFWSLNLGWPNHERFDNLEETRLSVFRYAEPFFNPPRIRQTLGYRSLDDYEAKTEEKTENAR